MNKHDRRLLDECLTAMQQGASLEDCLRLYPEAAPRLRPLLETAALARSLGGAGRADPRAQQQSRGAFLSTAAALSAMGARQPAAGFSRVTRSALTVAIALVLVSTALIGGSQSALPGQPLYGVKRAMEQVQARLQPAHAGLDRELRKRRLDEVLALLSRGEIQEVSFEGILTGQYGEYWTVSGIDVYLYTWTVSGIDVYLSTETMIMGVPGEGRLIRVHGTTRPDETVLAMDLTVLAEETQRDSAPAPVIPPTVTEPTSGLPPAITPVPSSTQLATYVHGGSTYPTSPPQETETYDPFPTTGPLPAPSATPAPGPSATPPPPGPTATAPIATPQPTATAEPEEIQFEGILEQKGAESWVIAGQTVSITGNTEIRDNPQVGQRVKVKAWQYPDGRLEANRIELDSSG